MKHKTQLFHVTKSLLNPCRHYAHLYTTYTSYYQLGIWIKIEFQSWLICINPALNDIKSFPYKNSIKIGQKPCARWFCVEVRGTVSKTVSDAEY